MFRIPDASGKLHVPDPKLRAYKYLAYLQACGRRGNLTCLPGEHYEVSSPGLETHIYVKEVDVESV